MEHKCGDGGTGKMRRDPRTPIGEFGPIVCTRCGHGWEGQQLAEAGEAMRDMLTSPFVRRALAKKLPAKVVR